jgi:hypothetical protein
LPVGVSNDTTVRCPLCHAHYTLADALVNMPPLLEVVEDAGDALPAEWYDEPSAKSPISDEVAKPLAAAALPENDSEADTLEMGSLELESLELDAEEAFDAAPEGAAQPLAEDDDALLDFDAPVVDAPVATPVDDERTAGELTVGELSEDELTAGALPAGDNDELSLDFGGESLSAEEAAAETLEFTPGMVESFDEKSDDEVKFDLESEEDLPGEEAATIEFGAPLGDDDPLFGDAEGEVKFDFDDGGDGAADEAETVRFESPTTATSDDVEFNFDAPEAESSDEGLRGFEDIKVDASGEAEDIPLDLPVAAVSAVPAAEELATGKKGKKDKKKKEKKPKVASSGDKPKRSLVGMLAGLFLGILAAMYGSLWLGPDYDFLSIGKFLPSAVLPAEFSKKKPTQLAYVPPATVPTVPAAEPPVEEPAPAESTATSTDGASADAAPPDAAATEHSAARPVEDAPPTAEETPPAATPTEEMPAPADAAAEAPTLTPPGDVAATPDATTPAAAVEADPFAPADSAATTPATPEATAEPEAEDPFAPAKGEAPPRTAEMPADQPAATAGDDLFAPEPTDAGASVAEPPGEMPAAEDPFAPAPAEKPADAPAEADPFAPVESPATPPETTRPAEADPFAPADKPAEMPADAPAFPPDKPLEEDIVAPAPEAMPETRPADADPFAPAPAEKPAAEALPAPVPPADAPAEESPLPATPTAPAEALGPRSVAEVSPAALQGAVQSTFVSSQQLIAAEATGDEAQLRKARAAFYVNLFGMADAITSAQLGAGGAAVDQQLQSLGGVLRQQLAADPKRLDALKVFGARWIGFPKRTTNGVVVSGTVESAEQVGRLFHTKARLGSSADAPLVTIVTAKKPEVASGDVVLALGSIVDDPQQKISGYEGNDPAVVWSGMTMKVAP